MKRLTLLAGPLLLLGACSPARPAAAPADTAASPAAAADAPVLRHLAALAADSMEGRRAGTPGAARARRYLLGEIRRIGVQPVGAGYEHPFRFAPRGGGAETGGVNLLAQVVGTRHPDRWIVVTAHYDHVGIGRPVDGDSVYNGADDNASGAAALLAIADHFRRNPPETSILFAWLDAEEQGLQGARAFVAAPPVPRERIVMNVNMDMVSHSDRRELYAAGASHTPVLREILQPVADAAPIRLLFGHDRPEPAPSDDWTMQSDQGVFHEAGIPFLYFGVEDHPDYHRPSDEVESITPAFFVDAVRTITDAVGALDRASARITR